MLNDIMNKENNIKIINDPISDQYNVCYFCESQNILFDNCTEKIKLNFFYLIIGNQFLYLIYYKKYNKAFIK